LKATNSGLNAINNAVGRTFNTVTIDKTGMICTWPFDKPIAKRVINVSSILIRIHVRVGLKNENRVIKRNI
jgi:hypothetical protein